MKKFLFLLLSLCSTTSFAYEPVDTADRELDLNEVVVTKKVDGRRRSMVDPVNTEIITGTELFRAACCNLGESFTTNPSVDVSYNDAATGARQIKLLGLAGTYVQMLTENIPNFRGSALPYGLGYIAGPWIQSIQVSKGASSVKNGYESISGQINIEIKKPQATQEVMANAYADLNGKLEVNANANQWLTKELSTGLLVHGEKSTTDHDSNHDTFMDMPRVDQVAAMNRWAYVSRNYIGQAGVKFLAEKRESGQSAHHMPEGGEMPLYEIGISTVRWEAFAKNAYIFDHANNGNVALILSGSNNNQHSHYGGKLYHVAQGNFYGQLMLERTFTKRHELSVGLSCNYDRYSQSLRLNHDAGENPFDWLQHETVTGAYAQYTFNADSKLLAMGGVRYDYSTVYGSMFTPRLHVRWNLSDQLTWHLSAGRGYRAPHIMAENAFLLASSRSLIFEPNISQEEAWNFGTGVGYTVYLANKPLRFDGEYYYTHFTHQLVVDMDTDPHKVYFRDLSGRSYSHTVQLEVTYPLIQDMNVTAAYRYTDVKVDYGQGLMQTPLTSRHKGLLTIGYAPMMGLWQFDVTCSVTGGGRMPTPYTMGDGELSWSPTYRAYPQLSAQITRNFRHWAIYIGGENLTNYRQQRPVIGGENPWGTGFDATMVYGPLHGANAYIGFRYTWNRY